MSLLQPLRITSSGACVTCGYQLDHPATGWPCPECGSHQAAQPFSSWDQKQGFATWLAEFKSFVAGLFQTRVRAFSGDIAPSFALLASNHCISTLLVWGCATAVAASESVRDRDPVALTVFVMLLWLLVGIAASILSVFMTIALAVIMRMFQAQVLKELARDQVLVDRLWLASRLSFWLVAGTVPCMLPSAIIVVHKVTSRTDGSIIVYFEHLLWLGFQLLIIAQIVLPVVSAMVCVMCVDTRRHRHD